MIALFYRAWADAHPAVQVERKGGGRVKSMLQALAGIGMPDTRKSDDTLGIDPVRLQQAAALAHQAEGPERLTLFLAEALRAPVRLIEFLPTWVNVPAALQTRIHRSYAALGRDAAIGPRTFQRQSRIELRIGPLSFDDFKALLPGGKRLAALKAAIRELIGSVLDVDLRIVLRRDEVPPARLGEACLARTAWLAPPAGRGDAEDMRLRTAVGWHPRSMEAAA
jgi:type VI secretion system protein ImpH